MPTPRASRRIGSARPGRGLVLGMGFLALALLAVGCAPHTVTPQTTVFPKTESARQIQNLYAFIFWAATFVFFVVQGAIVYILWRYRYRPDHPLPEQVHGNTRLEIAWTVLPAVILVGVAIPTIQTMFALENPPPVQGASGAPAESLTIDVTGYQWWWKYEYPEQGIVTANELVIPTGRTINLRLTSADVIHSFWIPELMGKQDVMPAHVNGLWFTAEEPGQYFGQCAEYCGIEHALMRMNAIALGPADWEAWVARTSRPAAPTTDLAQQGAEVFTRNACVLCHAVAGTSAQGQFGPNLSHFGSRTTLAAGVLPNTTENLALWLRSTDEVKPGNHMANPPERWNLNVSREYLNLRPDDVTALVEYLHSLK